MKTIKTRIMAIALVCIMLLSIMPLSAFASDALTIAVESKNCAPGEEVSVKINLSNNPGIASMKLKVAYDSTVLTLNSVEYNTEMGGQTIPPQRLSSPVTLTWVSAFAEFSSDCVFATLNFTAAETTESNKVADITISYNPDDIYNMNEDNVDCNIVNGSVTVITCVPGDINGDGTFNNKDITRMFQYLAGWDVVVNEIALDTNGDKSVNNKDLTRLFQYAADWDVEIFIGSESVKRCSHQLETIPYNAPTCISTGNQPYWHCVLCDKYYSDAVALTETSLEMTVIPTSDHTRVIDEAVDATCTKKGLTTGAHCAVCKEILVPQMETDYANHTPGAEATCTEASTCKDCGELLESAKGHIPGAEATCVAPQICTVCEIVLAEKTAHKLTYVAEQDPVDNKNPGNCAYWHCSVCNKCYLDEKATQEIELADTAWKTYLVHFIDLQNNTYTTRAFKQSEILFLSEITPADMDGYDFNGWHTDENFTDANKISIIPEGNTETKYLYANRTLHKYTVTLLGIGREEVWTYKINNGIKLTTPKWKDSAGEGDCLIFSHWSDEKGNKITEIPKGETGNRTIEANWIYKENYAVSNKNKYTYVGGVIDEQDGKYSFIYEIGAINNIVLSKQHEYVFEGLVAHTETEEKSYTVGSSAGKEAAKTISRIVSSSTEKTNIDSHTTTHQDGWNVGAKWKPEVEIKGIKISAWEFSGGYSESDTDTYVDANFTTEKNYTEDGTENEIRSTVDYYNEESVSRTVSDTFVPGVTPVGNYTWARLMDVKVYAIVTYNPYTGNYVFDIHSVPTRVHNGMLYTLPSSLDYDVNIVSGDILDFEIPFEEIPEKFYTVEYNANGGTSEMPKSVHEIGVSSTLFPTCVTTEDGTTYRISRPGYTFIGWKTSTDTTATLYTDGCTIRDIGKAGETVQLYAQWDINNYTITYDANGGSMSGNTTSDYTIETALTLPTPTRTGYTFGGWKVTSSDGNWNGTLSGGIGSGKYGNVTLTAIWTANTYTVTYNANGATSGSTSTTTHTYDTAAKLSANGFSRTDHTFLGWSTNKDAITPTYTDEQSVINLATSGDLKLYAIWVKTTYSVQVKGLNKNITNNNNNYTLTILPGMSKNALEANKFTKLKLHFEFKGRSPNFFTFNTPTMRIYSYTDKELYYGTHNAFEGSAGPWTWRTVDYTMSITDAYSDGSFWIKWSTSGGSGSDGWCLDEYVITVTATK